LPIPALLKKKGVGRLPEFICVEKNHKKRANTACGMTFDNKKDFDEHMKKVYGYRK
jgi:hypothetical protein